MRSKPKPGSSGSFNASSPLTKQAADHFRLCHGPSGIDANRAHRAVGAEELASSRRAPLPCLPIAVTSMCGQPRQIHRDHVFGRDRFGKTFFHDIIRQRLARTDRRIALPSACSSSVVKPSTKSCGDLVAPRAATSPMVFNPARRRPRAMAHRRRARTPAADRRQRPPRHRRRFLPETCRVSVRAQIEVAAIAALTAKPCRVSAPHMICSSAASPPNRWAQPVMSRYRPCGGIERDQRRETVAPVGDVIQCFGSATRSASNTVSSGQIGGHWRAASRCRGRSARPRSSSAVDAAARCFAWRRRRRAFLVSPLPACRGGSIASKDAIRVGETLSTRTVA